MCVCRCRLSTTGGTPSARKFDVDIGNVVAAAGTRNDDPVMALESVILERWTKISTEARAADLDDETITRIWRAAEQQEPDSGWRRVQEETAARVERRTKAGNSARAVGVDIDTVMSKARAGRADPLTALESATTKRQEAIWEEARTAGLDDNTINRVYAQGEQQQSGAGYRAIESATVARIERWRKATNSARAVGVDIDTVMSKARAGRADPLTALESATTKRQEAIWEEARTAGLDDNTINRVYAQGEQQQSGAGYRAIESATVARIERRRKATNSARAVGVDIDTVMSKARAGRADPLTALESATTKRQETIWEEARTAGLDDSMINRVYLQGEEQQSGAGYRAIESATVARVERQREAANSARAVGVDIDTVMSKAWAGQADPLTALESATTKRQEAIWEEARTAGLDDSMINRVYLEGVRLFFVEEFSPYSWAFLPADASLQCSFRGDSNQASAYPRLSGGQPSLETVPNTVGLSPSGALPSGHSRGVLVRCRGKGGRPAMAVTTGFQGRTFDVPRTGVPCIDLPSPAPCAAADAVFADAKAFLSSSEARQMSESELERELHRQRQDLVRKLLQGHRDQRSPKEAAGPAEDTGGVECSEPREHESHAETTSGTMQVVGLGCARRGHDGLHRLDAALNLLPERYLVEMRRRVTIATASRAPPRTPWKPPRYSTSSTWQRRRGVRCSSSARRRACRHLVRDPMGVDRRTVTFGCSCGGSQPPQAAGALMRTETSHEAREDQRKSPIGR